MPEMHLSQSGFTYSARGSFSKSKERIQRNKGSRYIHKNELDKVCFPYNLA